jgi:undecaprenyl diphosphate synthase
MTEKNKKIPTHIAIIPDGNRRWAKEHGLPSLEGHRRGANNFEHLIKKARELGIKYFTGWAFSTENWKRTQEENAYLFDLLRELAKKYKEEFIKEKMRFVHIGRKDRISDDIAKILQEFEEETKDFTDFTVAVAMDYGGHDELIRTIKKLEVKGLEPTKENIEANLDTKGIPMPDLIIRPGGELRLSGFMSWQCAYAEFYFPDVYFPDFGPEELEKAIDDYSERERRFGGDSKK